MTDTAKQLREFAGKLEAHSAVGAVLCTVAAHEIERLDDEVLALQTALNYCVDKGTHGMVCDALRELVEALSANDEDGLTEFAPQMAAARAALQPHT